MAYINSLETEGMPFFARFLEEAAEEPTPNPDETTESDESNPPPIWTLKWPSDWEDC
jgi:hypothetical protein